MRDEDERVNVVASSVQPSKNSHRIFQIVRLADDLRAKRDDSVSGQHNFVWMSPRNDKSFAHCIPCGYFARRKMRIGLLRNIGRGYPKFEAGRTQ